MIAVEKNISQLPNDNGPFFTTLHKHLGASESLHTLHLINLKLGREAWGNVAKGVADSQSLRSLRLNKCNLSSPSIDQLHTGIGKSNTLTLLDLSHNDLDDASCGTAVVKLLQA